MVTTEEKIKIIEGANSFEEVRNAGILPEPDQDDGYYFVSYSHSDYKQVLTDIIKLQEKGVKIWYDRGLESGLSWLEDVCRKIDSYSCKGVLIYVSERLVHSESCEKELSQAIESKKSCLLIKLDGAGMPEAFSVHPSVALEEPCEKKISLIRSLPKPALYEFELVPRQKYIGVCATLSKVNDKNIRRAVIPQWAVIGGKKYPVRIVGPHAFSNCENLTEVVLSRGWCMVLDEAFANCYSLKKVIVERPFLVCGVLPLAVMKNAFTNCTSIETLDSIQYADKKRLKWSIQIHAAFHDCTSLRSVDLNDTFMFHGDCFNGCTNLESVKFRGKQHSSQGMFAGNTALKSVEYDSKSLETSIESATFAECVALETVKLPKRVKSVGPAAFYHCVNLTALALPKKLQVIGPKAFAESGLKELHIPQNVKLIVSSAFEGAKNLSLITIDSKQIAIWPDAQAGSRCELIEEVFPFAKTFYLKQGVTYQFSKNFLQVPSEREGYCKFTRVEQ